MPFFESDTVISILKTVGGETKVAYHFQGNEVNFLISQVGREKHGMAPFDI